MPSCGFAAVEAYPDLTLSEDETSGARPAFWHKLGFEIAVDTARTAVSALSAIPTALSVTVSSLSSW